MKERRKQKYKADEGLAIPRSMHPSRQNEYRLPVCNLYKTCGNSMTNRCMYCMKNYSVWTEGEYVPTFTIGLNGEKIPKFTRSHYGPSGQRFPKNLLDYFVKKPSEPTNDKL
jgi:hypothetical protein